MALTPGTYGDSQAKDNPDKDTNTGTNSDRNTNKATEKYKSHLSTSHQAVDNPAPVRGEGGKVPFAVAANTLMIKYSCANIVNIQIFMCKYCRNSIT